MAKIKVHELAKELELQSKDILNFLQEKGIEAKAAQSSLEEDAAALVRNSLGQKKATAAPAVEKEAPAKAENTKPVEEKAQEETKSPEETKKKKKIIFVSNPQNSKMPGQRQGGQNGQGQRNAGGQRPNQGQNNRYQNNGYQNNSYNNRVQAQTPVRPIKPLTPPSPTPSVAMVPGNKGQQPAKKPVNNTAATQAPVKEQAAQNTNTAAAQARPAERPQNNNRDNRQGGYGQNNYGQNRDNRGQNDRGQGGYNRDNRDGNRDNRQGGYGQGNRQGGQNANRGGMGNGRPQGGGFNRWFIRFFTKRCF